MMRDILGKIVIITTLLVAFPAISAYAQSPPVVSGIPDQTIAEGQSFITINLDDYVVDDSADNLITWTYSGNTNLTIDITSRVATITAPADWNGSEAITFRATDPDLLYDEDAATFTVTGINDAPVVTDIPSETIAEGGSFATITLDDYVSDIDDPDSTLTWTYTGNTNLTVDITNRVATITAPADWNGSEAITFRATDDSTAFDEDAATFTVTGINDAPVVTDIPDQIIAEGSSFTTITLDDYVSDIDDPDSTLTWTYTGNTNLTVDITNRVATITAPADWNGSEAITFRATDDSTAFDEDAATFTVTGINDSPVVTDIPDQIIAEGASFTTITLDDYVSDIDDDDSTLTWTYTGNTYLAVDITNRVATITAPADWNGSEAITFRATDDSLAFDEDAATFTVTGINDAPVVTDIPSETIAEGGSFATITLDDYVSDIDDPDSTLTWTYTGNTNLTVDITNRVATITAPADWNGSEAITFRATDDSTAFDEDAATFTVTGINDAPVVTDIPDQIIAEGSSFTTITLDDYVSDIDDPDSTLTWTYTGNTNLTVDITNRVATITAPADWNGSEAITFRATDDSTAFDEDAATFTVTGINDSPVVTDIPDQIIAEGASFTTITLDDYVSDIDDDDSTLTWTYTGNTYLAVDITNRVATITAPADWNGSEAITFRATDPDLLYDEDAATFTVTGINDAPVVTDIPSETIAEGGSFATITLDDYVSDIDDPDSTLTWTYTGNTNLTVDITNRVATITAPADWNGSEAITFRATDDSTAFDEDAATFTVTGINDAPVVTDIPDQIIAEGSSFTTITLDDYVSDIDDPDSTLTWTYTGNTNLTVDITNRVATITAPADWNGSEAITFRATDDSTAFDEDAATFTVTGINDSPVVTDIPDQIIAEGASFTTITLDDYVSDIDDDDSTLTWTYTGNTYLAVDITNRVATITVPAEWNGSEAITFRATDDSLAFDEDAATFTVTGINDAPVVTDIPSETIAEGGSFATITLDDYVSDIDDPDSTLTWTYTGNTNLTVDITNRVATITAPADWNGSEAITFRATDDSTAFDEDAATFTVTGINDAPVVTDIPDQIIAEGSSFTTITLDDYVSDIDDPDSTLTWTYTGNTNLTVDITNRVATITAPADWNGSEAITFRATDDSTAFDEDAATFTVTGINDSPVVTDIPDQIIAEGASFTTITLDDYVSDIDNSDSTLTWTYTGNTNLTVDITSRVATITAPAEWNGTEAITFRATDDSLAFDEDAATFTVTGINDSPVVTDIPDQIIAEGASFTTITLDDYVSDIDDDDSTLTWTYTGNTYLTVDITSRVATITASAEWNGDETITFRATDDSLAFDEDAATFTVTGINDAPVVTDIPDQIIAEGASFTTITLDDYVSDIDDDDSTLTWTYTGNTYLAVDITNRVATITAPADWNGSEAITFRATDDSLAFDEDAATFTVTGINDAPVVTDIPSETIAEGGSFATITLDDYVSDIDDPDSTLTWTYTGNTNLTVDITNRVATITAPADWNGSEAITFRATDDSTAFDEDAATFTVTGINDAPVVTDIPDQIIAEGSSFTTITLDDYVSDIDDPDSTLTWTYTGNTNLTVDITNRVATITAPADWNGSEAITFRATDDSTAFDEDAATFTVTGINDSPVVTDIPDQIIAEGASFTTITLDDYVSDIDDDDSTLTWTYTGNTYLAVDITNRVATITVPAEWNGSEAITFRATDDSTAFDEDAATFTVTGINDSPVVTDIPDQIIAEGASFTTITLDDYVSDIDNSDSTLTWTYTGNTNLTVDITSRVATITAPAEWNGTEAITFRATDDSTAFDEDAATFTVTGINDSPVVTDIPDQIIAEGNSFTTITLDDYVSDIDNPDSTITWSVSGDVNLSVSIDINRVATIGPLDIDWNGSETITFRATDDSLAFAEDAATFTITAVNDAPVVADIPDPTIPEGSLFATISLDDYVSDVDNHDSLLIWSKSGNIDLLVDITDRVATIIIPYSNWYGSETITFRATDPSGLYDSDPATFTVTNVNDAPVVSSIPGETIAEGGSFATINLDGYVDDIDNNDDEMIWTVSGDVNLSVSINVNRVATITALDPDWNGSETITFRATDDSTAYDEDAATFIVTAVNDAPVVADIPNQSIAEGESFTAINLDDYVADVDNADNTLTWTYSGNTDLAVDITNRVATITAPTSDWNGTEIITFRATDNSTAFDEDAATFAVGATNDAPVVAGIPDQIIAEGSSFATINLDDYVTDIDNTDDEMTWTYSGNSALTVNIIARVATISIPGADWNGSESIVFTATDPGLLSDSDTALFTVTGVNDAPMVADIPDETIAEGGSFATINLDGYVTDIDNPDSTITWSISGDVNLSVSIDASRVATITPLDADWNGSETITFRATDDSAAYDEDSATFTVTAVNDAPVVADIPDQSIPEGSTFTTINLDDYVADVDNADNEIAWTKSGNSELLVDITNRVATIIIPGSDWNGSETITFRATDDSLAFDEDAATFTVWAVNDAPVVTDIPGETIAEGGSFTAINLDDYVADIDDDDSTLTWSYSGNTGLIVDITNRIATISTPTVDWNGTETITFRATDDTLAYDEDAATFTVSADNDPPVVADIPDQIIAEGAALATISLDDYVADVDDHDSTIIWTYTGNSELVVSIIARVATITAPSADWHGSETITFRATDPGALYDEDSAGFTITSVNDVPVVADIPGQIIAEGGTFTSINLDDYVSDVDDDDSTLIWTYSGNADLAVDITNRVATITAPTSDWFGFETITFRATDDSLAFDEDAATFTVTGVNDAPVVTDIPSETIAEGGTFTTITLDDYVSDIDDDDSTLLWTYSGNSDLAVDITNRVATITAPTVDWYGSESITFRATDDSTAYDEDAATFTVTGINDGPVVSDIPDQVIAEGATFTAINLDDYVADVDDYDSTLTWTYTGNADLTVDITNRVATIAAPAEWNGNETITFRATDDSTAFDENAATFTVTGVNDAPVVTDIPGQTIAEGGSFIAINLDDYVSDIDDEDSTLTWTYSGNTDLIVDITNRVATISAPSVDWNGTETITFRAADDSLAFDEDAATFEVTTDNDPPVVADIPDQIIAEGASFTTISLDDYVADVDDHDSTIIWTYTGNSELVVSIIARVATITAPSADWHGSETITFRATDPGALYDEDSAGFTITSVNDVPVVADIPDQIIAEGNTFTSINLDDYVSDVDDDDSTLTWTYSGNVDLSVSIIDRIATITAPSLEWNGSEAITFRASDDSAAYDEDAATFAVTGINDTPVVTGIPDQIIAEGATFTTITLDDYVSDIDDDDSTLTWTYTGNTDLAVDITDRVATITAPTADWYGSESITFRATDDSTAFNEDAATFTVTGINDGPVVADIPDETIAEGAGFATVNLDDYVTDIDNPDSTIDWTVSGEANLSVSIDGNRVATITPLDVDWNGSETITFRATDDSLAFAEDSATFTVTAVNDAPVVADIPDQIIQEGSLFATINLDDYVSDVDNADDEMTWSKSGNIALSVDITNRVATIIIPNPNWNGSETITFRAADPNGLYSSDPATFTVTTVNDAPVVSGIPDETITEGGSFATINLDDYVSDIDNNDDDMTWTVSGDVNLAVSIDVNRVATITALDANWNGSETLTFRATDDSLAFDEDAATFTVTAVNDAPVVADIPNQSITEGETFTAINLDDYVSDVDNDDSSIDWTYSGNIDLTVVIDGSRVATITAPSADWNGSEVITFRATDDSLAYDEDSATFAVGASNDAPVVSGIPDQTIAEGSTFITISLDDYVTDIDNTDGEMTWTYSGNSALTVDITARVATITIPTVDWNGSEAIVFIATDPGLLSDSDTALFTVTGINDAPVVADIPDQNIPEGSTFASINLDDYVTDIDNHDSTLTWTYSGNSQFAVDITDRVATITVPSADWNGAETITFRATDDSTAFDEDAAMFTVWAVNDAPVVADIPDQAIPEGSTFATINLDDYVDDIDNPDSTITWTKSGNIEFMVDITNRVATIIIPGSDWNGEETITFRATDDSSAFDVGAATFTVWAVNDAPVVTDIPGETIAEGGTFATINLDDYVSDIDDDDQMTWSYSGNTGLIVDITNRIATITTPDVDWNGTETITFRATDDTLAYDEDPATFTVTPVNDAPVLAVIGSKTVSEGGNLNFINTASDIDGDSLIMSAINIPDNASYDDNYDGTGTFNFDPDFTQEGDFFVTFIVSDGPLSDSEVVQISVTATNLAPFADAGPDQVDVVLGNTVSLDGTGSYDPDGDGLTYSWTQISGPAVTLSDATDSMPAFDPMSPADYDFELVVSDGQYSSDPDTVSIGVINRDPPVAISDLQISINGDGLDLSWSAITVDTGGFATNIGGYIIYRDTVAYFTPQADDSIGATDALTLTFTDNNINGADVVGDTLHQYFYCVVAYDIYGNRSDVSNRVGEFDYQIITTSTTDFNLIAVPFENSGITTADDLISAIGSLNVNTVNNYQPSSQNFESRFAAGFGVNFSVSAGGIYQVNAAAATVFSVAGEVPSNGATTYQLVTTATTNYSFISIPFEREADFQTAQDVLDNLPGSFNTLNRFDAGSQSYESRFAAGFGVNFPVKAGKPYQANAASDDVFPGP